MIARLVGLALVSAFFSVFSISALANDSAELLGEARMKQIAACGEVEGAKHLTLAIPFAIISIFSPQAAEAMKPYQAAITSAANCADISASYRILAALYTLSSGQDPEVYFSSPEGKEAIDKMAAELRKLNP